MSPEEGHKNDQRAGAGVVQPGENTRETLQQPSNTLKGAYKKAGEAFFRRACRDRTRVMALN